MRGDELKESEIDGFDQLLGAKANQLFVAPQRQYFGAVFLTEEGSRGLEMLINREGFIPDDTFETLITILRQSLQLSVRVRASIEARKLLHSTQKTPAITKRHSEDTIKSAQSAVKRAQREILSTKAVQPRTATTLIDATNHLVAFANGMVARAGQLEVLASVGTLTAGVVHEFGALLGMSRGLEERISTVREHLTTKDGRAALTRATRAASELRQSLERQGAYLTDIVGVDARRNRSKQSLMVRFDAAVRLYQNAISSRNITVINDISADVKSASMFPAELLTVLTNLISNAIKAAGAGGRIRASCSSGEHGETLLRIENTGDAIDMGDPERWFAPFESTTTDIDPELGQGMGLGLTIVRNVLHDADSAIRFVKPRRPFASAVEVVFSK